MLALRCYPLFENAIRWLLQKLWWKYQAAEVQIMRAIDVAAIVFIIIETLFKYFARPCNPFSKQLLSILRSFYDNKISNV